MQNVWILGGYQSDFARNHTREDLDFADLTCEIIDHTLASSRIKAKDVGVIHVANAFGELFAAQAHLGAMPATVHEDLWSTPSSRHEAACASGSVAVLAAMADIRSGAYQSALVLGVELEKTVPGHIAARHMSTAAWTDHEGADATFLWPAMFSDIADAYAERYGLDEEHLSAISTLNHANAKANPNAQTRAWAIDPSFNPVVEGRIRKLDCSHMADGGAGVILVNDDYLRAHPNCRPIARIDGWGHRTVGLALQPKLDRSLDHSYLFPHVHQTVLDAFGRARVTLDDLDGFEVHDCFTPSEYLAIDHIGLTDPGESWQAIEEGDIEMGGRLPINPSGGLLGGGHPVGATGVRMVLDAAKQVSGTAGGYQVDGAKTFGTLNFGGSTATTVSFIVGEAAR